MRTGAAFEAFLTRLYVEPGLRDRFLRDAHGEARRAGLSTEEAEALSAIDRDGLALAAAGFARKREEKSGRGGIRGLFRRRG